MRLTLKIITLPLLAGLIGSFIACSEGTSAAPGKEGDGGSGATGGEDTTQPEGGADAAGGTSAVEATAGTAGIGAEVGTGGSAATSYTKCFDFVESSEQWKKNYASVFTLEDKTVRDEEAATKLLNDTMADWMADAGYGGPNGYVKLTIPFPTTQSEYQGLLYSYLPASPITDMSGKTVHAFVKLVSGMTVDDPNTPSGAKLVVKSGADYFYGDGGWVNLGKNEWTELLLDVDAPNLDENKDASLYDPNDIRELSVEFDTSGSATEVVSPGVVLIDHVCY